MEQRVKNNPIAVFDSGVGGVSVLRELVKVMPNEDFMYYGDSANAPYGTKSHDQVQELTLKHAEDFFRQGAKGLVVACNTATAAAVRRLREIYPEIPIVGIEPALKPAVEAGEHQRVLIMATPITTQEEKLRKLIDRFGESSVIYKLACPGLMEFVERGELYSPALLDFLHEILDPYRKLGLDSAVLGCTHYPFLIKAISEVLGDDVKLYDGAGGTAREMRRRLKEADLLTEASGKGKVEFFNSLPNAEEKVELCKRLLETV